MLTKEKKVTIEFLESTKNCFESKISEDGKEQEKISNIMLILRAGKKAIYLKNMPEAWLESIIEKGIPFNPTRRKQIEP